MWENDTGFDVTAAFLGITTPIAELYDEIAQHGWTVKSLVVRDGYYIAQVNSPHGEQVEATGNTDSTAVGNALMRIKRREQARMSPTARLGAWSQSFDDRVSDIALDYARAKTYDPRAASAWMSLAKDCERRAHMLGQQLQVDIVDDPDPYKSLSEMADDVLRRKQITVSRANAHHPLWSVDQVVAFRLTHDVLGHIVAGGDWGWHGMNMAFAAHAPLLTPEAQRALFTETLGQGAYNYTFRALGPQKIVFLDSLEDIQNGENAPGHSGTHPSESILPAEVAQIPKPERETTSPKEGRSLVTSNESKRIGQHPVTNPGVVLPTSLDRTTIADPNANFQSGVTPLPDNAYLWQKLPGAEGPIDPLDYNGLQDASRAMDSRWYSIQHPEGGPDMDSGRQAVANAFRSVLLAPRKSPQAGAQHYQAVQHLPAGTNDPVRIHDTIQHQRDAHNTGRGYTLPQLPATSELTFRQYIRGMHPRLDDAEINEIAKEELFHMRAEEEESATRDDTDDRLSANEISQAATANLIKRLRVMTNPRVNQRFDFGSDSLYHSALDDIKPYPAHLAQHSKSVASVGHRIDDLYHAAVADMKRGGSGHHFRARALSMELPGVGAKDISHAWQRLSPTTSQLGVISPTVLRTLGHKPSEVNNRDYYKFERELAAGRDAAGYNHIPLGNFSVGLHDHVAYGPGYHDDLSHLAPINPTPHNTIDWDARSQPGETPPGYWWDSTQPSRDQVGQDWDQQVATITPSTDIPFSTIAKVAGGFSTMIPFFTHPTTGEMHEGQPGQSLMQHMTESLGLSTPEVWALDAQAGKR